MLAAEVVQKAETRLREIVAEAAVGGDYASVVQIASWAKALRDLLDEKPAKCGPEIDAGKDTAFTNGKSAVVAKVKNGRSPAKTTHAAEYPRFFRKGDELVRVAWSRRTRSEYQHKTTTVVLKSITDTLSRLGKEGRIFSTDEVLPLRDAQGTEIPAYQAYVVIALLKLTGLIEAHGRQGYSIASNEDLTEAVNALWRKLPTSPSNWKADT